MNFPKIIVSLSFFLVFCGLKAQYIQVDDTYTAQQLVENVLIDSPCANVSNFSVSGDTFSGGQQSYGYFNAGSSGFPFADGIVLSTARANRTPGPNSNLIDEGSIGWTGDQDLEQALGIGTTYNATVLEFDFIPLTSHISFDYIFASEEYQGTAPCQYSDGFAFLLKPANSTQAYQNLALIPNTNTPVLVTSVHPTISGSNGCQAENEAYFGGFNGFEHPTNFNGQTIVMTASANVIPGVTYHIKLVIADEENIRYDSAIFLGGGTFSVGADLGPDRLFATNNPICFGESYTLDATEPAANSYQWYKDGLALSGETSATYSVTSAGQYAVEIILGTAGCIATGEVAIEYAALPVLNDPTAIVQCDDNNDGISVFNLNLVNGIVTFNDPQISEYTYYLNLADAQNQVNPISNPESFSNSVTNSVIARVTNSYGCTNFATVNLQIADNFIAPQDAIEVCDTDESLDGISNFNLETQATPQILNGLPTGLVVKYFASAQDAVSETNPLSSAFINTVPLQQIIFARIINGPDCYGVVPITLIVHTFDSGDFSDETLYICENATLTLTVASGFANYSWSTNEDGNSIIVTTAGNYSVTVTDVNGCTRTKNFVVIESGIATITSIDINDFAGDNNSVTVNYTGSGGYEFSMDGSVYQESPVFTNVALGEHVIYVNDTRGCGTIPSTAFFVMDYPHYFTPNGDGYNDIWEIKNLHTQPNSKIYILDRYGKLIYSFFGGEPGWNGKMDSVDFPSADYWFTLFLEDGRTVKSHFTLKR